jgi:hypothetical protein
LAAVAWKVNDEVRDDARQQLLERAPALVGAGRGLQRPVRPIVLVTIAGAGLALNPDHGCFRHMARRWGRHLEPGHDLDSGSDEYRHALTIWWRHLLPVNFAMTEFLLTAAACGHRRAERDQLAITLLDACLTTVERARTTATSRPEPVSTGRATSPSALTVDSV